MHPDRRAQSRWPVFVEDQRQYFDELIDSEWDAYCDPVWDRTRKFEVDSLLRVTGGGTVLDIGCGSGFHDLLFAQAPEVSSVTGVDYSERSVVRANASYPHPKVTRLVADYRYLSAGPFDIVVSYCVITHLRDWHEFLDTCQRLTHSGGHVGVYTPNGRRLENRLRRILGKRPALIDPQHFTEMGWGELARLGESVGLRAVARVSYGLNVPSPGIDVVPKRWSRSLGSLTPSLATRMGIIFRKA